MVSRNDVSPLILTSEELISAVNLSDVEKADIIIGLSKSTRDMDYLWGKGGFQKRIDLEVDQLHVMFVWLDFKSYEYDLLVSHIRRVKEKKLAKIVDFGVPPHRHQPTIPR